MRRSRWRRSSTTSSSVASSRRRPVSNLPTQLIAPHGGRLNERLVPESERAALADHARSLPSVTLDARQVTDLELLAVGALSPLDGFIGKADYDRVIDDMH